MEPNGPVLSLARVSVLFHCPQLNNHTKIKLSQQTTKPRVEFEHVLAVGGSLYDFSFNCIYQ